MSEAVNIRGSLRQGGGVAGFVGKYFQCVANILSFTLNKDKSTPSFINIILNLFQTYCQSSPCVLNATCQEGFGYQEYRCICPQGYHGDKCQLGKAVEREGAYSMPECDLRYFHTRSISSSETQGQLVGARESRNGRKKISAKKSKVRNEEPLGTQSYRTSRSGF